MNVIKFGRQMDLVGEGVGKGGVICIMWTEPDT